MSYLTLARKYRPNTFSDVLGQESIIKGLTYSLLQNTLASAYLLTGTRGVGKTTLARLIALAVNCETGITDKPCHQCTSCISIMEGNYPDVYEVDGASKTKVDDIRSLLENTQSQPFAGRYKVYIIDEVHMLSNHAFNALLKTLEEPPSYVLFILATTELEKIPITVRSRCMHYALLPFTTAQILTRCELILQKENITYEDQLINIAEAGRGSMRDALTLLEQVVHMGEGQVTNTSIQDLLLNIPSYLWKEWLAQLYSGDRELLTLSLKSIENTQINSKFFLEKLLQHWFQASLDAVNHNTIPSIVLYDITIIALQQLSFCPDPQLHIQMLWLKLWYAIHHHANIIQVKHIKTQNINHVHDKVPELTVLADIPKIIAIKESRVKKHIIKSINDYNNWVLQYNNPGLLGEALKYLTATQLTDGILHLSYSREYVALFNDAAQKKLILLLIEILEINNVNITLADVKSSTIIKAIEKVSATSTLSVTEQELLTMLGYTNT